jgi:hypothetical protein
MKTVLHFEGKKIGAEEMSRFPSARKKNEETGDKRERTGKETMWYRHQFPRNGTCHIITKLLI